MNKDANNQRGVDVWRAEALRLTVFLDLTVQVEPLADWNRLVGKPPDQRHSQPAMHQSEEVGAFGKGVLAINGVPGRIDLHYQPVLDPATWDNKIPDLGSLPEALGEFVPLALKWLDNSPPVLRLAFGAEISVPAPNHEEAYRLLDSYLHTVELDTSASDFNYSINRKRPSCVGIKGLRLNRLSRWYALLRRIALKKADGVATAAEFYSCRLDMDINTGADFTGPLAKEKLKDIFRELVSLASEIAEKGDVP